MNTVLKSIVFCCTALWLLPAQAQKVGEKVNVLGADNIAQVVKSSLNAIPNLRVNYVNDNFDYKAAYSHRDDETHHYYSYTVAGYLTLDQVGVTMADGTVINFENKNGRLYTNNDLFVKSGYENYEIAINVWIDGIASVSGKQQKFTRRQVRQSPNNGAMPIALFVHSPGAKYIDIGCTGVNEGVVPNIKSAINMVRAKYEQLKKNYQSQQNAGSNATGGGNASATTLTLTQKTTSSGNKAPAANKPPTSAATRMPGNTAPPIKTNTNSGRGNIYEQVQAEQKRQQELQRQRTQYAIDPAGQILKQSGITDYFDAAIERGNREAAAASEALDRKLEAQKREREAREREKSRALAERQQSLRTTYDAAQQKNKQEFEQKGGYTNYTANMNIWHDAAAKEVVQVNSFLQKYKAQPVAFKTPQNNCDYVEMIERVQNSSMPIQSKNILIGNVMGIRAKYNSIYQQFGLYSETEKTYFGERADNLTFNTNTAQCGNYLDYIDKTLNGNGKRNFGANSKWIIKNQYDRYDNYDVAVGRYNRPSQFIDEVRTARIWNHEENFSDDFSFLDDVINRFHMGPYVWNRSPGTDYKEIKVLYDTKNQAGIEIEKFIDLYNLRRKYALNTVDNELDMAFFMYHTGNTNQALSHFRRYLFMQPYGRSSESAWHFLTNDLNTISYYNREIDAALLAVVLYTESKDYNKALQMLDFLAASNNKSKRNSPGLQSKETINEAIQKLRNDIYYGMGQYSKMQLLKSKDELKQLLKVAKTMPESRKYIIWQNLPQQANAWVKLGNVELAEAIYDEYLEYYYYKKTKTFYGRPADLDAFKETSAALFPNKKPEITSSKLFNYNIFGDWHSRRDSKTKKEVRWFAHLMLCALPIQPNTMPPGQNLSQPPLSDPLNPLANNAVLQTDEAAIGKVVETCRAMFDQLDKAYQTLSTTKSAKQASFLKQYIQVGMATGKFHEIMPAMQEFAENYPAEFTGMFFEQQLLKLMWQYTGTFSGWQSDINGIPLYSEVINMGNAYKSSSIKTYFDNALPQNIPGKNKLTNYLQYWRYQQISAPSIPYLYRVAATDASVKK